MLLAFLHGAIANQASVDASQLENEYWDEILAPPCDFDKLFQIFGVLPAKWIIYDLSTAVYHPINRTMARAHLNCRKADVPMFHIGLLWQDVHDTENTDDYEEGDFDALEHHHGRRRGALAEANLWPGGVVVIDWNTISGGNERAVRAGIKILETYTCLQFKSKGRSDDHWIKFNQGRGCSSALGYSPPRGQKNVGQSISLGQGCGNVGVATHEMLHAIGFLHEQSRWDRDDFIRILEQNIRQDMLGQFTKQRTKDTEHPYDWASLMHYGPFGFSRNRRDKSRPSIADKRGKATITGQRSGMSQQDVDQVNLIYKGECTKPVPRNAPIVHNTLKRNGLKCRNLGPSKSVSNLDQCAEAIYQDGSCPTSIFNHNSGNNDCRCCTDLSQGAQDDSGYKIHFATGQSNEKGLGNGSTGPAPGPAPGPNPGPAPRPVPRPAPQPTTGSSGSKCCGTRCSNSNECSENLFCCPFHKRCMDKSTKSTRGPLCCKGACLQQLARGQCRDVGGSGNKPSPRPAQCPKCPSCGNGPSKKPARKPAPSPSNSRQSQRERNGKKWNERRNKRNNRRPRRGLGEVKVAVA